MKRNMFWKVFVIGIFILFLLSGIFPSTVGNIGNIQGESTLNSDGYIQLLIDNASDGDTIYVPSGIYYENIIINKSISLIGEDKKTTIIDGGGYGNVVNISADWVNINRFTIQNGYMHKGIHIDHTIKNCIRNNIIMNNEYGIYMHVTRDNIIKNNDFISNENSIFLCESIDNIIINNYFINNNRQQKYFDFTSSRFPSPFLNIWILNYWNGFRLLPKLIPGTFYFIINDPGCPAVLPWYNIDWRPALIPYDINDGIYI
jgi:parallel beta-helix repeat protein